MSSKKNYFSIKDKYCNKKDEDYTMDDWEEKIGNGSNVQALAVHQGGGDDQPF
jgi:hypothetical protein